MSDHLDCGDCLDRLAEFLDKDFDPALAAQLSTHLEECSGCSKTRVEDALVQKVATHLKQEHNVTTISNTLANFVKSAVRQT